MKDWMRYAIFTALGVFNLLYSGRLLAGRAGGVAGWLSLAIGLALVGAGLYLLARELRGKGRGEGAAGESAEEEREPRKDE